MKPAGCGVVNPDDQQPQSPLWSCSNKVGLMSCWIMRINVEDWWQDLTLRNTGGMRAGFEVQYRRRAFVQRETRLK